VVPHWLSQLGVGLAWRRGALGVRRRGTASAGLLRQCAGSASAMRRDWDSAVGAAGLAWKMRRGLGSGAGLAFLRRGAGSALWRGAGSALWRGAGSAMWRGVGLASAAGRPARHLRAALDRRLATLTVETTDSTGGSSRWSIPVLLARCQSAAPPKRQVARQPGKCAPRRGRPAKALTDAEGARQPALVAGQPGGPVWPGPPTQPSARAGSFREPVLVRRFPLEPRRARPRAAPPRCAGRFP
jgi:hypothetical protein